MIREIRVEVCLREEGIAACVTESGYADPIPFVERRGLRVDSMTPEEHAVFNNGGKIAPISGPLLIMHGREDSLIHPREAELNFQQAGSTRKFLTILDGVGHNDILLAPGDGHFTALKSFFDDVL